MNLDMETYESMREACRQAPDDMAPRNTLSDWLEENRRPAHAAAIRRKSLWVYPLTANGIDYANGHFYPYPNLATIEAQRSHVLFKDGNVYLAGVDEQIAQQAIPHVLRCADARVEMRIGNEFQIESTAWGPSGLDVPHAIDRMTGQLVTARKEMRSVFQEKRACRVDGDHAWLSFYNVPVPGYEQTSFEFNRHLMTSTFPHFLVGYVSFGNAAGIVASQLIMERWSDNCINYRRDVTRTRNGNYEYGFFVRFRNDGLANYALQFAIKGWLNDLRSQQLPPLSREE